eukprot:TRINITY_DN14290_c0_g1_i2.p2 TRINITY_DN14290_c0_g1~~TRINITY_DN14290_c0_g1_i2.p2  ORF type:complete len:151 (+),score=42.74 TRINITY_DN14290_c0_g1_i2:30-482(+)
MGKHGDGAIKGAAKARPAPRAQGGVSGVMPYVLPGVTLLVAFFHAVEAVLTLGWPSVYAPAAGVDGIILCRLLGVLNVLLGAACLHAVARPRRGARAIRAASFGFHLACTAVFLWDVGVASGVALSSFGFMMLVHSTCTVWLLAMLIGHD